MISIAARLQDIACEVLRNSLMRNAISPAELEEDGHIFTHPFREVLPREDLQSQILSEETPLYVAGVGEPALLTVESQSPAASAEQALSSLICAFGRMPVSMLNCATCPQPRWDEYSDEGQVSQLNVLLDAAIKNILTTRDGLEALHWVRQFMEWPLGELLDGHEFLPVIPARRIKSRAARQGT